MSEKRFVARVNPDFGMLAVSINDEIQSQREYGWDLWSPPNVRRVSVDKTNRDAGPLYYRGSSYWVWYEAELVFEGREEGDDA